MKLRYVVGAAALSAIVFQGLESAVAEPTEASEVPLNFTVDIAPQKKVVIGKGMVLSIGITYPKGTKVYFPESPDVSPFVLLRHDKDMPVVVGEASSEIHRLTLLPVRLGTHALRPIAVPYVAPDGQAMTAFTPRIEIEVDGMLSDETSPTLAPLPGQVEVLVTNPWTLWGVVGLLVALVAGAMSVAGYKAYRRYVEAHRPPPPPRPAIEVAMERLQALEEQDLVGKGELKRYVLELSGIFKEFIERTHEFDAREMTSWEILWNLKQRNLGRTTLPEIDDLLTLCDLIKFARYQPPDEEARELLPRTRELVQKLWQANAPKEASSAAG